MKSFSQFLNESIERRALMGWNAKDHAIAASKKQKELDDLDKKYGDTFRNQGTRRHDLHTQIQRHKKKQKELGG